VDRCATRYSSNGKDVRDTPHGMVKQLNPRLAKDYK
jgi:hypothetical protein